MDAFYEGCHDVLNYEPSMDTDTVDWRWERAGGKEGAKFATLREADDTVGWTGARTPLDRAGGDRRSGFEPRDS